MGPTVIEIALNGETPKSRNANVPHTPEEIARDAIACLRAGAAALHNHMGDINLNGQAAADRYALAWRPIRDAVPEVVLCPTTQQGPTIEDRLSFLGPAVKEGARQASIDPGVDNFATSGENGLPGSWRGGLDYSFDMIERAFAIMAREKAGPALGIYEPGFLRPILAYKRAGTLPRGALARLYFGGDHNFLDGVKGGITFGLPPTRTALDAYIEMIGNSGVPWSVAVPGGDVVGSGLARHAIERGGHLRVGIEDHAGERAPTNLELVEEAATLCRELGRPPATCREAAAILDLP